VNIYHITSKSAWIAATRIGSYAADSLDSEGFIHCSTAAQVVPVAERYYGGQTGLVLLVIDTARVDALLKWEQSTPPPGVDESATFPHVYGPIDLGAIIAVVDFEPNGEGEFWLPPLPPEGAAINSP
jgi:uncharacterized protein (DUF952 family)